MPNYTYHGEIITANSKKEAIQQIIASKSTFKIDMKVVNKWMKKNLDITDEGLGKDHWKINGNVYYTWGAAKRLAKKVGGYHLPTPEEWDELFKACGCTYISDKRNFRSAFLENNKELIKKLKIKFVGMYRTVYKIPRVSQSHLDDVGSEANFWSDYTAGTSVNVGFVNIYDDAIMTGFTNKKFGFSVRLVRN